MAVSFFGGQDGAGARVWSAGKLVANQQDQGNNQTLAQLNDARKNFALNKPFLYDGLLGFLGASDSGHMICTFQNAWLFILN